MSLIGDVVSAVEWGGGGESSFNAFPPQDASCPTLIVARNKRDGRVLLFPTDNILSRNQVRSKKIINHKIIVNI